MFSTILKFPAILVVILLVLPGPAYSVEKYDPPFQIFTAEFPPYSYLDKQGQPAGAMSEIMVEILKEVAHDGRTPPLGDVKIQYVPWKRAFKTATEGKNIVLYPAGISKEREALLDWFGPRLPRNISVYALKSVKKNSVKASDLKGQLIGVTRGYSWEKDIRELGATPDESVDDRTLVRKIMGGRMTYMAVDEEVLRYTLMLMSHEEPAVLKVEFQKVYSLSKGWRTFGISENSNPYLLQRLQAAYQKLENNGTVKRILGKHFAK